MHSFKNFRNLSIAALLGAATMLAGAPAYAADTAAVADFNSCAKPKYPQAALKAKHTGTVTLAFLIDESGTVADGKVKDSSGHADLDQAALDGIKLCKFAPGTKDGKPHQGWMHMKYIWTLK